MRRLNLGVVTLTLVFIAACATVPYTGRNQLMLVSEGDEINSGVQAYRQILRQSVVSENSEALRIVRRVGERIARVANKPEYRWEFRVINDPENVNAFCVPGGKVAVYTGIFPVAKDEAGLAVILGHEVAHALLRHAAERMSQAELLGGGLAIAGATGINPNLLQALGLGANLGVVLPFSRSQESEADHVGLILMAKAGYDPRAALEVWERMERKERGAPPEFLSTHPGSERRIEQLRAWMPEALQYYHPIDRTNELLPSGQSLDSVAARDERELLKRIQAINSRAGDQAGERVIVEALGYNLRMSAAAVYQERQQLQIDYGQYAALKGLASFGRGSMRQIFADFQRGESWTNLAANQGTRISELNSWMADLIRTTGLIQNQLRQQPLRPGYRLR